MAGWWSIVEGTSMHAGQADPAAQATWIQNDQQAQVMIAIFIHPTFRQMHGYHIPMVGHGYGYHGVWVGVCFSIPQLRTHTPMVGLGYGYIPTWSWVCTPGGYVLGYVIHK
jgi:hypothetical protein